MPDVVPPPDTGGEGSLIAVGRAAPAADPGAQPPLVLIVEDEAGIAELVRYALEDEGIRATVAHDGRQGVRLATDRHPGLVLLDVMLPLLGGEEVAARLKELPGGAPPIVLLSASSDIGRLATTMGAAGFIRKPFDLDDLIGIVRRTLELSASRDADDSPILHT